jgi:hypothetical protein
MSMHRRHIALASLLAAAVAATSAPCQVDGIYLGDDGGTYYARSVGGNVFWFGEHTDAAFGNVMVGRASNFGTGFATFVGTGEWWDVPKGRSFGGVSPFDPATALTLMFDGTTIRKALGSGSNFGGGLWRRVGGVPIRSGTSLRAGFTGEGATGVWLGNDGGLYYVRQSGPDFAWFGTSCGSGPRPPAFANVYRGRISGGSITGQWADVPYGSAGSAGTLGLRIVSASRIERASATGGFGGSVWTRASALLDATVSSLMLTISMGSDDLRGGSVAYGVVELNGGRTLPRVSLNRGEARGPWSVFPASLPLPPGTRLRDLVAVNFEWDGAPRNLIDSYDNWNVIAVQVQALLASGGLVCLASPFDDESDGTENPWKRFKGESPLKRLPLNVL